MKIKQYKDYLRIHPASTERLAYTLSHGRPTLPFRTFCVVQDPNDLETTTWPIIKPIPGGAFNRPVFVFTGQGAQWARMGAELLKTSREFREDIRYMDAALKRLLKPAHRPKWTLSGELLRPENSSRLGEAELAQPACTALQVALVRHLARYDTTPSAVVGHSSGEIAAAFAAGVLSMEEAIVVAFFRGWVVKARLGRRGSMAAVGLSRGQVAPFLEGRDGVNIACENSNKSLTLSGDSGALQDVLRAISTAYPDAFVRLLKVDAAYHSRTSAPSYISCRVDSTHTDTLLSQTLDHMKDIGDEYRTLITPFLKPKPATIPFISSVTGSALSEAQDFSAQYWQQNLENPVLFRQAVTALLQGPSTASTVHLEVGPHSALAGPLKQIYAEQGLQVAYTSVLSRGHSDVRSLLSALGNLHCLGLKVRLPVPDNDDDGNAARHLTDLPPYPWDLSRTYWTQSRSLREWISPRSPAHELLGQRLRHAGGACPQWRCVLSLDSVPWVADHRIRGQVMFPAAGYVAMAGEVVRQLTKPEVAVEGWKGSRSGGGYVLRDLHILTALVMRPGQAVEVITEARREAGTGTGTEGGRPSSWWEISVMSFQPGGEGEGSTDADGTWVTHCTCRARSASTSQKTPRSMSLEGVGDTCLRQVDPATWYKAMARVGYNYGPRFRAIREIGASTRSQAARVRVALDDDDDDNESASGPDPGSRYAVHPIAIDQVLQAAIMAGHGGETYLLGKMWLPVRIDEVFVGGQGHGRKFEIDVRAEGRGVGDAVCRPLADTPGGDQTTAQQGLMSSFRGIRLAPVDSLQSAEQGGAIELVWRPDIDLVVDPGSLVRRTAGDETLKIQALLQEMFVLCALDLRGILPSCTATAAGSSPHLAKQHNWLMSLDLGQGQDKAAADLEPAQLNSRIDSLALRLRHTPAAAAARLISQCHTHARPLLSGSQEPLELFLQENALHSLYDWMNSLWTYAPLLQLLSHQRGRTLRILEVGAGTGGLTARVLRDLMGDEEDGGSSSSQTTGNSSPFGKYVFTDVSAGFFPAAKQRFAAMMVPAQLMEYKVLDISRPPQEQGFGTGEYDLVIASNVLHATPDLTRTLRHVRSLLRPDGRLLLQELACGIGSKWINFIMGFLPGWWLGEADGRADEPYLAPEAWRGRLVNAGFDGPEIVATDCDLPLQLNATMVVRPSKTRGDVESETGSSSPGIVKLLLPPEGDGVVDSSSTSVQVLEESLISQGYKVFRQSINQPIHNPNTPPSQRHVVVSTVDLCLQDGYFHDLTDQKLARFQDLVGHLQEDNSSILWLTQPCQLRPTNPSFAQCLGVARTVRAELGVCFATLEVGVAGGGDDVAARLDHVSRAVHAFIQRGQKTDGHADFGSVDQDMEMAYSPTEKAIVIPRARPVSIRSAILGSTLKDGGDTITALRATRPGSLASLEWTAVPRARSDLPPGSVRIRIEASGLNFKDVMVAMGLVGVPGSEDAQGHDLPLGCEAAGVVTAVGTQSSSQKHLNVGDRVAVFAPQVGCFATEVQVHARLCTRIPDGLSAKEAAGMPCVFTTVLRAFDKAGLEPGHTVLVHSAAGGVGLAAIQVARHLGVPAKNIYATAGSDEKRAFLTEKCGLPPSQIFTSRDDSFVDGLMAATGGRGADIVLNSLSGDLLHASWACAAPGGTLVELGKRDIVAAGGRRLAMAPFDDNRSFVAVDMARLAVQDPAAVGRLLDRMMDLYRERAVVPVTPMRVFDCGEVEGAFRLLSKSSHIGKVVLDMSDCAAMCPRAKKKSGMPSVPSASTPLPAPVLDPEAVYILVGGLGGLGTSISRWLALHGATSLAILSRSGGGGDGDTPKKAVLAGLLEMGCTATAIACDVTDEDAVSEAIASVSRKMKRRIAGVLFLPMVLADAAIADMTIDKWRAATDPKVLGLWNVHNALLLQQPSHSGLDFFVLFGSTSGLCGYPGQANYAAANSFLDAFAQYRRGLGLPCSVVDLGPVEDVGHVSGAWEIQAAVARSGARFVSEGQMLQAVQLAMASGSSAAINYDSLVQGQGQIGVGFDVDIPLEDARNSVVWKRDPRMVALHRPGASGSRGGAAGTSEPGTGSDGLTELISRLRGDPAGLDSPSTLASVARAIASRVYSLLSRELDQTDEAFLASVSLASLGIDSLVTIEVRNWWRRTFGSQVSSVQLANAGSLLDLAGLAVAQLKEACRK